MYILAPISYLLSLISATPTNPHPLSSSPVHGVRLHVGEPDLEVGCETLARYLQHGEVFTHGQLQTLHDWNGGDGGRHRTHALKEGVLSAI